MRNKQTKKTSSSQKKGVGGHQVLLWVDSVVCVLRVCARNLHFVQAIRPLPPSKKQTKAHPAKPPPLLPSSAPCLLVLRAQHTIRSLSRSRSLPLAFFLFWGDDSDPPSSKLCVFCVLCFVLLLCCVWLARPTAHNHSTCCALLFFCLLPGLGSEKFGSPLHKKHTTLPACLACEIGGGAAQQHPLCARAVK